MELVFGKFQQSQDFSTPLQVMSLWKGHGKCMKKKKKGHMSAVLYSQHHLIDVFPIEEDVGHKCKCCAIVDAEMVGDVLYDNWQGFHYLVSIDMWIGFELGGI